MRRCVKNTFAWMVGSMALSSPSKVGNVIMVHLTFTLALLDLFFFLDKITQ